MAKLANGDRGGMVVIDDLSLGFDICVAPPQMDWRVLVPALRS